MTGDIGQSIDGFEEIPPPASVIRYMARQQPLRAVFRDGSCRSDDAKVDVEEIFRNFSPDTSFWVL